MVGEQAGMLKFESLPSGLTGKPEPRFWDRSSVPRALGGSKNGSSFVILGVLLLFRFLV